jgi:hypothetical protein
MDVTQTSVLRFTENETRMRVRKIMLFITFHGGTCPATNQAPGDPDTSGNSATPVNNIHAYSDKGKALETNVLRGADDYLKDAELRGMAFHDGDLYVINGHKDANQILRFKGSGTKYEFKNVFASRAPGDGYKGINSIFHPFALTFQGKKHCYVSNQDTNIVTRMKYGQHKGKAACAAAIPSGLPEKGKFFDGTFVACSLRQLPGLTPVTAVPLPRGLDVFIDPPSGRVHFSARDVLATEKFLYVCDEQAGMVKVYDTDGALRHFSNAVPRPAHLYAYKRMLYLSGGDQFMAATLDEFPLYFAPVNGVEGKDVSGMAFDRKGEKLFIANRKDDNVCRHAVKRDGGFGKKTAIVGNMPDHPEFVLYVDD